MRESFSILEWGLVVVAILVMAGVIVRLAECAAALTEWLRKRSKEEGK